MKSLFQVCGEYGLYERDITTVKAVGSVYKVSNLTAIRKRGLVVDNRKKMLEGTKKLDSTLARAKTMIYEYAMCNEWNYFVTLTLDKEKYDRYNLKAWQSDLHNFLHNYNRRCSDKEKVKYVLIPEMHKDGAWHMHGLLKGIKPKDLYINEFGYMGWVQYEEKFGYISFGHIKDIEKAANYIKKYITKDMNARLDELGSHLYYSSKGLKKGEQIFRGKCELIDTTWDFESPDGYCRVKYFDYDEAIGEYLKVMV